MRAKVVLLARVKQGRSYPFVPVQVKKQRPVPLEGATGYYLRFTDNGKRQTKPVGPSLDTAFVAYQNTELNLARIRSGLAPIEGPAGLLQDFKAHASNRIRIADAVKTYLGRLEADVITGGRAKGTWRAYKNATEDFRDNCGVTYLDEVTEDVLRNHKLWLFANIRKRVRGKKSNTIAKRFRFLNAFFNRQGVKMIRDRNARPGSAGLIDWPEIPREEKPTKIDKYSPEEIKAMLSAADENQADLIHFFLRTGCRDEEAAYLEWPDVDFKKKQVVISEKPGIWKPKDKEQRVIPTEDGELLRRLEARKNRQEPSSKLVFPNSLGTPDMHLIRQLHKVVAKVKKGGGEIEGVPTLHRFRRTYASMVIGESDLQTVSELLGHSDIATTFRYLAPDRAKARKATRTAFNAVED